MENSIDVSKKLKIEPPYDRRFYPRITEYAFFSSMHGTFSWIHQMIGHKTSLSKFKKTEIILSMFPNHNNRKLKINKKESWKIHKYVKINTLKNQ